MARDRLSALRAQQQQLNHHDRWSYPTHAQTREENRAPAAYVQLERHSEFHAIPDVRWSNKTRPHMNGALNKQETKRYSDPFGDYNACDLAAPSEHSSDTVGYIDSADDMSKFYAEISSIQDLMKTFNDNVSRISDLHSRSLNSTDWATSRRSTYQLEGLMKVTNQLGDQLKLQIKGLHGISFSGRDGQIKKQQINFVKYKFIQSIQSYQQVEQAYRVKYKQRLERQLKVVNPDATTDEVKAVLEADNDGQLFSQMLQTSNRYGESRAVFRDVKDRHDDIKKIEGTLSDLARLFNDMETLVMKSGEAVDGVEALAVDVEKQTHIGLSETERAVNFARAARRKKWMCIGITVIIMICFIIAVTILAIMLSNGGGL